MSVAGPETSKSIYVDRELVFRFFVTFARFEYALKRLGFLKEGKAEPDWVRYTQSFRPLSRFDAYAQDEEAFREARRYLFANAPMKQVIRNGALDWDEPKIGSGEQSDEFLFRCVTTIRNNLFHGGKFPSRPVPAWERDRDLLSSSIVVLEACITLDSRLATFFQEDA